MSGAIPLLPHIPSWPGQRKIYLCLLGVFATGNDQKKNFILRKLLITKFLHFNVPEKKEGDKLQAPTNEENSAGDNNIG
jgi:hypothetical protein